MFELADLVSTLFKYFDNLTYSGQVRKINSAQDMMLARSTQREKNKAVRTEQVNFPFS